MAARDDDPYPVAIGLLARREHSAREIERKLTERGFERGQVAECIGRLQQERLQSDERFAESYLRVRSGKGYGPVRIRAELAERGVAGAVIDEQLATMDEEWQQLAVEVRRKRFGNGVPQDYQERARQARFLQYRGFAGEQLRGLFNDDWD